MTDQLVKSLLFHIPEAKNSTPFGQSLPPPHPVLAIIKLVNYLNAKCSQMSCRRQTSRSSTNHNN